MNKLCSPPGVSKSCIPGCRTKRDATGWYADDNRWCSNTSVYTCAWPPNNLYTMLRIQMGSPWTYNELVVGTTNWLRDPVNAIEAFFFFDRRGLPPNGQPDPEQVAKANHARLVNAHPEAQRRVPVLRLNLNYPDGRGPFTAE